MKPFICNDWHAWESNGRVMLSDERVKKLRDFASTDDCISWLYLNGDKPTARKLNQHVNGK